MGDQQTGTEYRKCFKYIFCSSSSMACISCLRTPNSLGESSLNDFDPLDDWVSKEREKILSTENFSIGANWIGLLKYGQKKIGWIVFIYFNCRSPDIKKSDRSNKNLHNLISSFSFRFFLCRRYYPQTLRDSVSPICGILDPAKSSSSSKRDAGNAIVGT